jgi:2,4-dienoyl-CoA reductase-like NADH-dependent reductase (Old Yellow Enzyme family)/thioredoxin reductase
MVGSWWCYIRFNHSIDPQSCQPRCRQLARSACRPDNAPVSSSDPRAQATLNERTVFPLLMSPFRLGRFNLRNRIVSPPHGPSHSVGGLPSDRNVAYYEERARGGVAYLIVGGWTIDPRTRSAKDDGVATDPQVIEGFRRIGEGVHRHGSLLALQLHWNGRQGAPGRRPLLAPSPIPDPIHREIPMEMEAAEIDALVEHYGIATAHARHAGWDGVEVFAAQGYGLSEFLSPHTNRRRDEYGGDLTGRVRLLVRIVDLVREVAGPDLLVGVRMNGHDLVRGGLDVADACEIARRLELTHKIDYLSISGSTNETHRQWIADMGFSLGQFVPYAAQIRQATNVPLLVVSRIKDARQAEDILAAGHVDLIGMNRALIADPYLPRKVGAGRVNDVRPCIYCNQGCIERLLRHEPMSCTVNPAVGLERDLGEQTIAPATVTKNVAVVGGGPAGLEAARLAAERGHRVTLFEKRRQLGGQIELASRVASRAEFASFIAHQARQLSRLRVEIRLDTTATATAIREHGFDAVVIATGSIPLRTGFSSLLPTVDAIPGHDRANVLTAWDVLEGVGALGDRVLILEDDPHSQAITVAEYLGDRGKDVTLVTRAHYAGMSVGTMNLAFTYQRLFKRGVTFVSNTWVSEIAESSASAFNVFSGTPVALPSFDSVVLATGNRVNDVLFRELHATAPELRLVRIGDCVAPRRLDHAVWDGHHVGRTI